MTAVAAGVLFVVALALALAVVHRPLGDYMYRVYTSGRHLRVERAFYRWEVVPASELQRGDRVIVEAGEIIPGDGDVLDGIASVDESVITGRGPDDRLGGSGQPAKDPSARVVRSMPGAPPLRCTVTHARHKTSLRTTLSRNA